MEPADLLVTFLLIGAVGSVLLTWLFWFLASALIECPECRQRVSHRHAYCGHCGEPVKPFHVAMTIQKERRKQPGQQQAPVSNDSELNSVYQAVCRLSRQKRSELNALMKVDAGKSERDHE